MFESLQHLANGFGIAATAHNLLYCLLGCIVGTIIGVLPGIGPIAGIALLIPATFGLNPTSAIIMLAGIYYGTMYGGSTTSILLPMSLGRLLLSSPVLMGIKWPRKVGPVLLLPSLPLAPSLLEPLEYSDWSF